MKKPYISPSLADYGSITDCTFATPARGGSATAVSTGDGTWACAEDPYIGPGSKNHIVLQCDKFGEYSHS